MSAFILIVLTVGIMIMLEVVYEKLRGIRANKNEVMEDMINDGVQTSIRMLIFGVIALFIAFGLSVSFGIIAS